MRKTVIDGSNTSGFQRTVLIAHDGFIETSQGIVGIETIALEEDAARPSSKSEVDEPGFENSKIYKLDRLGIPLVEITTKPDLRTPEQIKEAALKIGEIIRAAKVKRGIGTIRQDLNVSIKGSERVEIKGFQEPRIMIKTVELEIERQKECLKNKTCKKEVRKSNEDGTTSFLRPMPGAARMYPETDLPLLKISRDLLNEAKASLPKMKHELTAYLKEFGLNDELMKLVLENGKIEEFKTIIKTINNPQLVVKALIIYPKEIAVKENKSPEQIEKVLTLEVIEEILGGVGEKINESDVKLVFRKIVEGKSLEDAMKKEQIDLKAEVQRIVKEKPGLGMNAYMGLVMAKLKGKVSGKEVMEMLKFLLK
jgi:Glu-tRNA(Gln) amidotransferase subunit E-like FAD-binding protein